LPKSPARLGELLETRGQITREQLLRALRNQKVLGGRLGTCLLEIEALSEEQLCAALGQQHSVPFATPEDLRGIPDDVLELLPAKVARRCRAIAFHASSTQVKVALMDARNLGVQDEISFVIGKRIRWHVAPELRLIEALEKHYGEECPARLAKLLDKMNRSRFLWARESAALAAQDTAGKGNREQLSWDARIAGVPSGGSEGREALSGELPQFQHQSLDLPVSVASIPMAAAGGAGETAASPSPAPTPGSIPADSVAAPSRAAVAPPAQAASPDTKTAPRSEADDTLELHPDAGGVHRKWSLLETEQRLLRPRERDDVARALLDYAAGLVERAVLFVVRKGEIAAWLWSGEGIDASRLASLRLRMQQPSVFAGLKQGGSASRGQLAPMPAHLAIADCFEHRAIPGTVVVVPVRVKDRLVAALFLEPEIGAAKDLSPGDFADLQRVVAKAEIAFELCIMQSKLRKA
jgi:hypothetical protein